MKELAAGTEPAAERLLHWDRRTPVAKKSAKKKKKHSGCVTSGVVGTEQVEAAGRCAASGVVANEAVPKGAEVFEWQGDSG